MPTLTISFLILVLARPCWANQDDLPRLFTTPEERLAIEQGFVSGFIRSGKAASPKKVVSPPVALHLQGYVYREGHETAWINGRAFKAGQKFNGVRVLSGAKPPEVHLQLKDGREITLRVGDVYDSTARVRRGIRLRSK